MAGFGILFSCSGNQADSGKITQEKETVIDSYDSQDEDFVLPPFMSVAKSFQSVGLEYVPGKTNPIEYHNKYSLKIKQLLNMGVYCTDLAYCALNGKTQEARGYLKAIRTLGNEAGLGPVFSDKDMLSRFDRSLDDEVASEEFIYELQERSEEYLQSNEMRYMAAVQFAGAWVEGMYLGADKALSSQDDAFNQVIAQQMGMLPHTIRGLESYPEQNAVLDLVIAELSRLNASYQAIASVKQGGKNANLFIPSLSQNELQELAAQVQKVRMHIVSVN